MYLRLQGIKVNYNNNFHWLGLGWLLFRARSQCWESQFRWRCRSPNSRFRNPLRFIGSPFSPPCGLRMFCRNLKAHHKAEKPEWRQFLPDSEGRLPWVLSIGWEISCCLINVSAVGKFFLLSLRPKISLLREPEIVTSLLEPTSRAFTSESRSASPQDSSEEFRLKCIVFVHTLILHWINIKEL